MPRASASACWVPYIETASLLNMPMTPSVSPLTLFVNPLTRPDCKVPDMAKELLKDRARAAREQAGFDDPGKAAARIRCSRTLIVSWEDGSAKSIGAKYLFAAARAYRVRPEWLATGEGKDGFPFGDDDEPAKSGEFTPIRAYAQAAGLGDGKEAAEYEQTHGLMFRRDSLSKKRLQSAKLAVMYGDGESMLPRIKSGDVILFDVSDTKPSDGDLFVIRVDGAANREYNVKRCKIVDDLVLFEADNPRGDHQWRSARRMDNKRQPITIIGRVRWIGSWED